MQPDAAAQCSGCAFTVCPILGQPCCDQCSHVPATAALRGHGGPRVGTELIHAERAHQINDRGFDGQHDIDNNSHAILAVAALHFIETAIGRRDPRAPFLLMDESLSCRPRGVGDPIHDLVKAGALIAAEIDRLRAIGIETAGNEGVWT